MKVKDVMHKGATCAGPRTPVKDIARSMRDDDVGAIPIRADGQLVGIVTDRDITCRAVADSRKLAEMTAEDVMSKNVICCSPDDDIETAIQRMEVNKVRRLAVTDAGKTIVGVLSLGDISHKVGKSRSGNVLRALSEHHA